MTLSALHVMVVEDHGFQRRMALRLLAELGVAHVQEARRRRRRAGRARTALPQPPDVVLVDLDMPGMDGIEFIGHVAQRRLARGGRAGQRARPGAAQHRADHGPRLRPARARQHREAADRATSCRRCCRATRNALQRRRRRRSTSRSTSTNCARRWRGGEIVPWFQPQVEFAQRQGGRRRGAGALAAPRRPRGAAGAFRAAARSAKAWRRR